MNGIYSDCSQCYLTLKYYGIDLCYEQCLQNKIFVITAASDPSPTEDWDTVSYQINVNITNPISKYKINQFQYFTTVSGFAIDGVAKTYGKTPTVCVTYDMCLFFVLFFSHLEAILCPCKNCEFA